MAIEASDDTALAELRPLPRWVAWRTETGDTPGKLVKAPYAPLDGRKARVNDPATWAVFDQARTRAAKLLTVDDQPKGVGIVLGAIDAAVGIGGVDLDTCIADDGVIAPWAADIVGRLSTYTEVSPSGRGLKAFFRYDPADLPALRTMLKRQPDEGTSRKWAWPGGGHPPAVELYLDSRYFAVTGQHHAAAPPDLRGVSLAALRWLIEKAAPAFTAAAPPAQGGTGAEDRSRSAVAFRLAAELRRSGTVTTFEDVRAALRADPRTADWCREKGEAGDGRELRRIWDKTEPTGDSKRGANRELQALLAIVAQAEVFRGTDGVGFADVTVDGHRETHPIKSRAFRHWLALSYFQATGKAASPGALAQVREIVEARAQFEGPERETFLRVGRTADAIYLDLGDARWRAVEVTAEGWRVIDAPPVRFRRRDGALALPEPARGGSVDDLRPLLNVDDDGFVLTVGWLLGALRGQGPYPPLAVSGEQGSAKSTFSTLVRNLVDPNAVPLRGLLRHDHDLHIAANNAHVLCFDNVSKLSDWLSDTMCRLATGGGFSTRELYADTDEVLFKGMRPILLNGIEDFVERPDLADRSIALLLPSIGEAERRTEADVLAAYDAARPRVLGALLDALATGLRNLPTTQLATLPRMADFALWVAACESALWEPGSFEAVYRDNRDTGQADLLEADVVAATILRLMNDPFHTERGRDVPGRSEWRGTRADLLAELNDRADDAARRDPRWPRTAKAVGDRVRRMATGLRKVGIEPVFPKRSHGQNVVVLRRVPGVGEQGELGIEGRRSLSLDEPDRKWRY